MKPTQYTTRQILIAYSLLIGLFLQSCASNYSLEPQANNKSPQQLLTHSLADLSIDSAQDLLQQEEEERQVLPSNQQTQYVSSAINPGALIIPASPTPSNISSPPPRLVHQKIQGARDDSPKMLVSQQQALAREQATSKQARRELEVPHIEQELPSQVVQTKPGQTVTFYKEAGKWKARIDEQDGSLHRSQVLPLYLKGPSLPAHLQPRQVHIIERNGRDGKEAYYIYVDEDPNSSKIDFTNTIGLIGKMGETIFCKAFSPELVRLKALKERKKATSQGITENGISTNNHSRGILHSDGKEIILFCGNPGSGKSALFNSIFQEVIFASGFSLTGLTKCHQEYLFENKLYVWIHLV
jgi:hypothetical protein